jgi:CheY-like chemotaxis protein
MKPPRILIAADKLSLSTVRSALLSYDLLVAANATHVFQLIHEGSVDLFLVDIHFDDSCALELIGKVRKDSLYAHTPILLFRHRPSDHATLLRSTVLQVLVLYNIGLYMELEKSDDPKSDLRIMVDKFLTNHR